MKPEYNFQNGVRGKYAGRIDKTFKLTETGGDMEKELVAVRRFAAEEKRVETGPIMFGDDWPGIFIRGDDAHLYASSLRAILGKSDIELITKSVLMGLLDALESSNARNNDAFPKWHEASDGES